MKKTISYRVEWGDNGMGIPANAIKKARGLVAWAKRYTVSKHARIIRITTIEQEVK